ncbi:MAG: hypothetical protein HY904_01955 [Deltaproteobacteria bacterium]|nr:hypothetical protein [Deltaproteobacteria bacterium]
MTARPVDLDAVRASRKRLRALAAAHPQLRGEPGANNVSGWEATLATEEARMATQQVGIRLPEELVARLDQHVERMRAAQPGLEVTRADAVRVLLTKALDAEGGKPAARTKKGTRP